MKDVKPLNYEKLDGLSERQLKEHHDVLYGGYITKWNQIQEMLESADKSQANATYSEIRELKTEQSFALDAIKLHEAYFAGLGGSGTPEGDVLEMINEDFGSFGNWQNDFTACGISARGWVILSYDLDENKLFNFTCDAHNHGGIWSNIPILVLDVYEHAYMIDYGVDRKSYLQAYFKNIDWNFANSLIKEWDLKTKQEKSA